MEENNDIIVVDTLMKGIPDIRTELVKNYRPNSESKDLFIRVEVLYKQIHPDDLNCQIAILKKKNYLVLDPEKPNGDHFEYFDKKKGNRIGYVFIFRHKKGLKIPSIYVKVRCKGTNRRMVMFHYRFDCDNIGEYTWKSTEWVKKEDFLLLGYKDDPVDVKKWEDIFYE